MQLYYIRHGQSVNNANGTTDGFVESSDAPLTEIGAQQAQLTAEYLEKNQLITEHKGWNSNNRNDFGLTHLYTSRMGRVVHTSAPIARKLSGIPSPTHGQTSTKPAASMGAKATSKTRDCPASRAPISKRHSPN